MPSLLLSSLSKKKNRPLHTWLLEYHKQQEKFPYNARACIFDEGLDCYIPIVPTVMWKGWSYESQSNLKEVTAFIEKANKWKPFHGKQLEPIFKWCKQQKVKINDDKVILYKAIYSGFKSGYGFSYRPGTTPIAPDWDGGQEECGFGLHFCASISGCFEFCETPAKFMACPVRLSDIRPPHLLDLYPNKIKARGCCDPIWEFGRYDPRNNCIT